jgi:hypothetical protein
MDEAVAQTLISLGQMRIAPTRASLETAAVAPDGTDDEERDKDTDEAPETPLDEPRPPRVEDPPSEPNEKGPYVVRGSAVATRAQENGGQR